MKMGISTASFYPHLLTEDAINEIGSLGIGTCEVFLESMSEYEIEFGEELERRIREQQISVYSVHSLCSQFESQLFAAAERQRRDSLKILEKVFAVARLLKAQVYVFHGPANMKRNTVHYDYKRLGRIASELADLAEEYGLKFSWENVYWCYFNHPEFGRKVMEHCNSGNLYFTLDIKQAMLSGFDWKDYLEEMGKRIANVHICDYNHEGKLLLPGRGDFDFSHLKDKLESVGYQGPVILEVYHNNYQSFEELLESYQEMERIFGGDRR